MKYENISWVHQSWMDPKKKFQKWLFASLLLLGFSINGYSQCGGIVTPACTNLASPQTTMVDVTALVCDGSASSSFLVSAGGLYTVSITAGSAYTFTLTPSGNNTVDPVFPGVMDLFDDAAQTTIVASSGPVLASAGMTPTTMSYIDNATQDETLFLSVMDKSCAGSWKDYTLTITCTTCELTCSTREIIAANADGCVSAASVFLAPIFEGPCDDSTLDLSNDDGTGATLSGSVVNVPAGVEAGIYTLTFEIDNCSGMPTTCTTELVVEPSSSCNSTNITLSSLCTTPISPNDILTTMCGDESQYTLFINGVQTNTVSIAGEYDVEVRYTPTTDGMASGTPDTDNAFFGKSLCWNTITVEDKSGPTCSLANADLEYNFVCGFESATATPTFTDCSGTVTANDVVELSIGTCGEVDGVTDGDNDLFNDLPITTMGVTIPVPTEADAVTLNGAGFALEKILVNIYSASDGDNTGTACEQFIYIFRPTAIVVPGSAFVTCGLETTPTALAAIDPQLVPYYVNPLYGTDNSTTNDFTGTGVEDPSFIPTMVDDNGNPRFVAIAGQDHSVCAFTVTFDDTQATNPCGMTTKFVRRYTVLDCCSNVIVIDNESQYIETVDNVAPTFTDCPAAGDLGSISNPRIETINESNTCATTVDFSAIRPTATDDCSDETLSPITYSATFFLVADDFSGTGTVEAIGMTPSLEKGSYRVEVVATDDCGNISTMCLVYLRIDDKVVPTVQCTSAAISVDGNGNAQVCASDRSNANDNCGIISSLEVKLMEQDDSTFGSCINVNCTDAVDDGTGIMVFNLVYRATDACGNTNISMCPAELQIKTAPQFTCPADVSVECVDYSAVINYGDPTTSGDCGQMFTTSFTDAAGINSCAGMGSIIRTHTISMNSTVIASCDQNITLMDTTDPTFDNPPADATAECDAIPDGSGVTASDECSTAAVTFVDVPTAGICADSYSIARTYTATDECGNTSIYTQIITVVDNTAPVFDNLPADDNVSCSATLIVPTVTATDNCDTDVNVSLNEVTTNPTACPNESTVTRTWTATDNCGNSVVHTQVITVTSEPITVVRAPDESVDCAMMDTYDFVAPTVTDSPCGPSNVTISGPVETDMTSATGVIQRTGTFTVTDDCGFSQVFTTTVTFTNCCTEVVFFPSITPCSADPSMIPQLTVPAPNLSVDDLNNISFKVVNISVNPPIDVAEIDPEEIITVEKNIQYSVSVCSSDPSFIICDRDPELVGCFARGISGRIFNEEFTPLEEVEVELMNTEIPMSMTNEKGEFSFEDLADQAYTVAAHKESDPTNGLTTYDLVVMAQHVLGISPLDSPYKLLAADVNMDETIDIMDMLELRQLILYAIDDFSVNTSWRFVNANYIFPDVTNPWLETIPELHNLETPSTDAELNFIAVKIGDLDCTAETRSNVTDVTPRDNQTLIFKTANQSVKAGSTFDVVLQPNQDVQISALQFTLDFDPSMATLLFVASDALQANDIAVSKKYASDGTVPFAWYKQQDVQFDTEQSITLSFEATRDLEIADLLDINSMLTKAAAYTSAGIEYNLSLEVLNDLELDNSSEYTLYQNQPNPFKAETVIGFDVAQDEDVRLTVFNLEGKMLYNAEFTAQAGYNSVVISKEELQSTGVLFYQLDAANYTTTKKMIILE